MIFNNQGELISTGVGYMKTPSIVSFGQSAIENMNKGISFSAMENKFKSGEYDNAFLVKYVEEKSKVGLIDAVIFERYLELLSSDSLYSNETFLLISTRSKGRMTSNSIAFKALLFAYRNYPVKSLEIMSAWNVINNKLLDNLDTAIKLNDISLKNDVLSGYCKIDSLSQFHNSDSDYINALFYAGIGDSVNYKEYLTNFVSKEIESIDLSIEKINEVKAYKEALYYRFKIRNEKLTDKQKWFEKSYFGKSQRTLHKILAIYNSGKAHFTLTESLNKFFMHAIGQALNNYKNFSPAHVEYLINSSQKIIDDLGR
jgi:hypothetical protein